MALAARTIQLSRKTQRTNNSTSLTWHSERRLLGRALQAEVEIYGDYQELAYYYAQVLIGSPPQTFSVIADTGSTILSVPCVGCSSCGRHQHPAYDPTRSTTAAAMPCTFSYCSGCSSSGQCQYVQTYAEGSELKGFLVRDRVYLGDSRDAAGGRRLVDGAAVECSSGDGVMGGESHVQALRRLQVNPVPLPLPSSLLEPGHAAYAVDYEVGCSTEENGLFRTQLADGILGLAPSERTLVSAM